MRRSSFGLMVILAAGTGLGVLADVAAAQGVRTGAVNGGTASASQKRSNLNRLMRPITVEFTDQRLEDIITYLTDVTGAEIETVWTDGSSPGLDKDRRITINVKNQKAIDVLERVLAKSQTDMDQNAWQMTSYGSVEIGPKSELNKTKRVEMYDINDLLFVIPRYAEVPEIDLEGVLQQSQQGGGGGGGQNPFEDNEDDNEEELPTREERANQVVQLLTQLVESDQWQDNGGEGGTIRFYQGSIIVNAPDYMHRQINGYPYWPASQQRLAQGNRRYVTMTGDTGNSQIDEIINIPVTAVVPGGGGGGNGGGGGGSSVKPIKKTDAPKTTKPAAKPTPKKTTPAKKKTSSKNNNIPKIGLR